jgi:hypothetical protein
LNDDADDHPIAAAWKEAQAALADAEADSSEEGRQRQIYICDKLADAHYQLSDILKGQGREAEANAAHRKGNEYWGRVTRLVGDQQNNTGTLSLRQAADQLAASRLTKFSTQ